METITSNDIILFVTLLGAVFGFIKFLERLWESKYLYKGTKSVNQSEHCKVDHISLTQVQKQILDAIRALAETQKELIVVQREILDQIKEHKLSAKIQLDEIRKHQ